MMNRISLSKRKVLANLSNRLIILLFWSLVLWLLYDLSNVLQENMNQVAHQMDRGAAIKFRTLFQENEEIGSFFAFMFAKFFVMLLIPIFVLYGIVNLFGYRLQLGKKNPIIQVIDDLRRDPIKARWESKVRLPVYKVGAAAGMANADRAE